MAQYEAFPATTLCRPVVFTSPPNIITDQSRLSRRAAGQRKSEICNISLARTRRKKLNGISINCLSYLAPRFTPMFAGLSTSHLTLRQITGVSKSQSERRGIPIFIHTCSTGLRHDLFEWYVARLTSSLYTHNIAGKHQILHLP